MPQLPNPTISILGRDPGPRRRRCNINACAFQQDAVVSFRGWQYVVFYSYLSSAGSFDESAAPESARDNDDVDEPLYIHLARRKLPPPPPPPPRLSTGSRQYSRGSNIVSENESAAAAADGWEVLVFDDYPQTVDDGHNTVQMGICPGDGTIHLSYDHHCDR